MAGFVAKRSASRAAEDNACEPRYCRRVSDRDPEAIVVRGAREHNLKNVTLSIPKKSLVVITGVSGSGKSSLAFDTIYAEGQRRYVESLSSYARQFLGQMDKPKYDTIRGLSPTISIEQKTASSNPRSTVGTVTEVHDYLRVLYASIGVQFCHQCGRKAEGQSAQQIVSSILEYPKGTKLVLYAPLERQRKGEHRELLLDARTARLFEAPHRRQAGHPRRHRGRLGQKGQAQPRSGRGSDRGRLERPRADHGLGGARIARR